MLELTIYRSIVLAVVVVVAFVASAVTTYSAKTSESSASLSLNANAFKDNKSAKSKDLNPKGEGDEEITLEDLVSVYQKLSEKINDETTEPVSESDHADAYRQAFTTGDMLVSQG